MKQNLNVFGQESCPDLIWFLPPSKMNTIVSLLCILPELPYANTSKYECVLLHYPLCIPFCIFLSLTSITWGCFYSCG